VSPHPYYGGTPKDAKHWYSVTSAEWGEVIPILDDGTGPTEYGCDHLWVRTTSAKRAKVLMVRAFRRRTKGKSWKSAPWLWDGNPFRGMRAERADTLDFEDPSICSGCEGTGHLGIHGVEDWCGMCEETDD